MKTNITPRQYARMLAHAILTHCATGDYEFTSHLRPDAQHGYVPTEQWRENAGYIPSALTEKAFYECATPIFPLQCYEDTISAWVLGHWQGCGEELGDYPFSVHYELWKKTINAMKKNK